ncbi:uncharacterized protein LOC62_04G006201 [Vanrija pseudolonga]|uniref:Uncharacterized protein n=1 Tax=Vanrija pseudolonga TaxID=143232 RepID=A0AAF0YFS0_9TREE|nr:hypothetical protein LOC62_04G006201 [Vanrija pseudolonga]
MTTTTHTITCHARLNVQVCHSRSAGLWPARCAEGPALLLPAPAASKAIPREGGSVEIKWDSDDELGDILRTLNLVPVRSLSILRLHPSSTYASVLTHLLSTLCVRSLRTFPELEDTPVPSSCVPALAGFLSSPRSTGLEYLALVPARWTLADREAVVSAIENNPRSTLQTLVLLADATIQGSTLATPVAFGSESHVTRWGDASERARQNARLEWSMARSIWARRAVGEAAMAVLVPARTILRARKREPDESRGGEPTRATTSILDLPLEITYAILEACAPPNVLSDAQHARLFAHASDETALRLLVRVLADAVVPESKLYTWRRAMETWLADGGFTWDHGVVFPVGGVAKAVEERSV